MVVGWRHLACGQGATASVEWSGRFLRGGNIGVESSEVRSSQPYNDLGEECFEHKTHPTAKALRKEQAGKGGVAETECEQGKGQQMGLARQQWPGCIDAERYRSGEGFWTGF